MTVTLELSPETAERIEAAKVQGVNINALLEQALASRAMPRREVTGLGKFAHIPLTVEDIHKERQADRDRENRE